MLLYQSWPENSIAFEYDAAGDSFYTAVTATSLLVVHLNQALFHPVTVIFMVQPLVDFIMLILGIVLWKRYYGMKILSAWSGAKKSGLRPKGAK